MIDYAALKTEIESGPLAAELAPLVKLGSDAGVADVLNRRDLPGRRRVPPAEIVGWMGSSGSMVAAQMLLMDTTQPLQARAVIASVFEMFKHLPEVNLDDPQAAQMIGGLSAMGILQPGQDAELLALGDTLVSRAETALGGLVTADDVSRALRGTA